MIIIEHFNLSFFVVDISNFVEFSIAKIEQYELETSIKEGTKEKCVVSGVEIRIVRLRSL